MPSGPADAVAPSPSPAPGSPGGFLAGVIVLDLATVGPAARCTRLLADYGATVVKVGAVPGRGSEPIRPPYYAYSGSRYLRFVALDLKDPDARMGFLALARTADVVVESFRPGVADRLGIGFDDLRAVNPRVILCSTTGFGQSGPRSGWAGHDLNYLGVGGYLAATEARADGGPPVPGATIADAAAGGMHAAMAVMAALIGRGTTGTGTHLDVSITDGVLWLASLAVDEHLATGAPAGHGQSMVTGRYACYDTYRAADGGWLAVGAIEPRFFANLCRHLGCEDWIPHQLDDERQPEIRSAFRAAFATKDRDAWVSELAGADTCVTPVLSVAELVDDPHFAARHAFVEAAAGSSPADGGARRFRQVGPVFAGMERPIEPVATSDPAGTDTERLLADAGLDEERIATMRARGVLA